MSTLDKLIKRLLAKPKDFTIYEVETLLSNLGYTKDNKGKTSGSRVRFTNAERRVIILHIPHPDKHMKSYAIDNLITALKENGDLK